MSTGVTEKSLHSYSPLYWILFVKGTSGVRTSTLNVYDLHGPSYLYMYKITLYSETFSVSDTIEIAENVLMSDVSAFQEYKFLPISICT